MALDLDAAIAGGGSQEERAQLVALELIRRAIADLPAAIASNASKSAAVTSPGNSRALGTANAATTMLAERFASMLGPLNMLNAAINSQTSGMSVLGSATKVLGATIGPILLPAVTVMSAALVGISDVIWGKLLPNLDKFDRFILSELMPAGEALVGLFGKLSSVVEFVVGKAPGSKNASPVEKVNNSLDKLLAGDIRGGAKGLLSGGEDILRNLVDPLSILGKGRLFSGGEGEGQVARSTGVRRNSDGSITKIDASGNPVGGGPFAAGMRDTLKELRQSLGMKASYSGLGDVQRNAQLAALNQSPFEAKILDRMDKVISALERSAAAETRPAFGEGRR